MKILYFEDDSDDEMFESHRDLAIEPDDDDIVENAVSVGSRASRSVPP